MKAVIFDMDGVIVDSEPLYEQHLRAFMVKIGISQPELLLVNLKGKNSRDTNTILIETFNLEYEVDELIVMARKAYLEHLQSIKELPAIPGVIDFIKQVSTSGYKLALASSASAKRIDLFLTKLGVKEYFPVIACGDDVERSKPAPDIFLFTAKKLGIRPSDCVVVEDAQNGVKAAKSAGMKCIAYAGSEHNTDDLSEADIIINDFKPLTRSLRHQSLPV